MWLKSACRILVLLVSLLKAVADGVKVGQIGDTELLSSILAIPEWVTDTGRYVLSMGGMETYVIETDKKQEIISFTLRVMLDFVSSVELLD